MVTVLPPDTCLETLFKKDQALVPASYPSVIEFTLHSMFMQNSIPLFVFPNNHTDIIALSRHTDRDYVDHSLVYSTLCNSNATDSI